MMVVVHRGKLDGLLDKMRSQKVVRKDHFGRKKHKETKCSVWITGLSCLRAGKGVESLRLWGIARAAGMNGRSERCWIPSTLRSLSFEWSAGRLWPNCHFQEDFQQWRANPGPWCIVGTLPLGDRYCNYSRNRCNPLHLVHFGWIHAPKPTNISKTLNTFDTREKSPGKVSTSRNNLKKTEKTRRSRNIYINLTTLSFPSTS